jgi:hypothetical protein
MKESVLSFFMKWEEKKPRKDADLETGLKGSVRILIFSTREKDELPLSPCWY